MSEQQQHDFEDKKIPEEDVIIKGSFVRRKLQPNDYNMIDSQFPIENLELGVRTFNSLVRNNIRFVSGLSAFNRSKLLTLRNFDQDCLQDLQQRLRANGFGEIPS